MKKILTIFIMTMFVSILSLSIVYANELADKLVIHYYRYDNNYTNHTFWLWENEPVAKGGKEFLFNNTDVDEYGAFYEINLKEDYKETTEFGIIIKKGTGWDGEREPGGDRFFDLRNAEVKNGVIHAYFVQADVRIGLSDDDLSNHIPDYRPNILNVMFNANKEIVVNLTHSATNYKLYENGSLVKEGQFPNNNLNQTLKGLSIDISKSYELEVEFDESTPRKFVSLQNLYDTREFENNYTYDGDLGVVYEKNQTTFRLWAPVSEAVSVNIYNQGHPLYDRTGKANEEKDPVSTHNLTKIENGAWELVLEGDYASKYYTFNVTNNGVTQEVTDPYSYSTGANGLRSMIVDFESTNPLFFNLNERPNTIKSFTDYIIWELHVRDLTTHSSWEGTEAYRGKFLGLSESGTTYSKDGETVTTGLDHIEELGVNAVHLLPIFDFGYIDEVEMFKGTADNLFNWGYMPYHFNTLEGSYSTNPFDGNVRINEFKQAVMAMHNKGIRVIMDVVYNHTGESEGSNFHKIIPGYFHRMTEAGGFSNGSGTGNETASERSMVRKFMVDSLVFLAKEYKLSGFRFDLMALHDIDTMNLIREELNKVDPTIVIYGEPWTGGDTLIDGSKAAGMTPGNGWDRTQIRKLDSGIAAFNDLFRDALKGQPDNATKGFLQGDMDYDKMQNLQKSIKGATELFTNSPTQNVIYAAAHDNLTLHDKLRTSGVSVSEVPFAQIQANAIVLTSMGIPFLHAGTEFLRSKPIPGGGYHHNSYESPDSINQLRWDRKLQYNDVFEYHKALIHIRKTYSGLRMDNMTEINQRLQFVNNTQSSTDKSISYTIKGINNEPDLLIIHAGATPLTAVSLDDGKTYMQLTSRASSKALYDTKEGLVTRSGQFAIASSNTSGIFVEVLDQKDAKIKKSSININKGDTFDSLSNMTIPSSMKAYGTNIDTSIPGFRVVTVVTVDYLGNKKAYHYVLNIKGSSFTTILGGL